MQFVKKSLDLVIVTKNDFAMFVLLNLANLSIPSKETQQRVNPVNIFIMRRNKYKNTTGFITAEGTKS